MCLICRHYSRYAEAGTNWCWVRFGCGSRVIGYYAHYEKRDTRIDGKISASCLLVSSDDKTSACFRGCKASEVRSDYTLT